MSEEIKVKCPSCKQHVKPILYWETDEEGEMELMWGADPETVQWFIEYAECPLCGEDLTDKIKKWIRR